jgi:hypothetical protein
MLASRWRLWAISRLVQDTKQVSKNQASKPRIPVVA